MTSEMDPEGQGVSCKPERDIKKSFWEFYAAVHYVE